MILLNERQARTAVGRPPETALLSARGTPQEQCQRNTAATLQLRPLPVRSNASGGFVSLLRPDYTHTRCRSRCTEDHLLLYLALMQAAGGSDSFGWGLASQLPSQTRRFTSSGQLVSTLQHGTAAAGFHVLWLD